jgi:outer membrane protein assembly factor BamB
MPRVLFAVLLAPLFILASASLAQEKAPPITVGPADWPWWRGPSRNGVADPNQKPPTKWGPAENVRWKVSVPGRGHGSPTVVGEQVFLATAEPDREVQSVRCYDRQTGKLLWATDVHQGGLERKGNAKSSLASSTVACDGQRLFINFLHAGAIYTTALDRNGKQLWQTKITDYVLHQGYGSSPAVYQGLVLVSADNKGGGVLAGLDRVTGKIVWKRDRPKLPNYASPILLPVAGRDQLLFTGCDLVTGLDPLTGATLWETPGSTTECVTSVVTDGRLVFTSGGYPKSHVSAVRADKTGAVAWQNKTRVYVPSMLVRGEHLYAVTDAGVAICWECATGKEVWKERLAGTFSSSPVLVGDTIYAVNEAGRTFLFKARPDRFEQIAENDLGGQVLASPAICGDHIYLRLAHTANGRRQEMLYCLGGQK